MCEESACSCAVCVFTCVKEREREYWKWVCFLRFFINYSYIAIRVANLRQSSERKFAIEVVDQEVKEKEGRERLEKDIERQRMILIYCLSVSCAEEREGEFMQACHLQKRRIMTPVSLKWNARADKYSSFPPPSSNPMDLNTKEWAICRLGGN